MIFSKATGYGIRALTYLANQAAGRPCGLREIAQAEQIPPVYLRKILGELRRHRLVRSTKGIHGGYEIARSPQAITLWEVFQLLEPEPDLDLCILGHGSCAPASACPLHEDWQQMRQELVSLLQTRTISQVAASAAACQSRLPSRPLEKRETGLSLCRVPQIDSSRNSED
jgi:Rrf2 family protein